MFTSLFLVCNIPLFINLMHNMTTHYFGVEYPGVYLGTRFMFWYSWHVARMESVVLNAALNPVLYYCRMKRFRAWCDQKIDMLGWFTDQGSGPAAKSSGQVETSL